MIDSLIQKIPKSKLLTLLKLEMWALDLGISGEQNEIFSGKTMSYFSEWQNIWYSWARSNLEDSIYNE